MPASASPFPYASHPPPPLESNTFSEAKKTGQVDHLQTLIDSPLFTNQSTRHLDFHRFSLVFAAKQGPNGPPAREQLLLSFRRVIRPRTAETLRACDDAATEMSQTGTRLGRRVFYLRQ